MKKIGDNLNVTDEAKMVGPIEVTSLISVTILPANPRRLKVVVSNIKQDAFIRLAPAGVTTQNGIILKKNETRELDLGADKYTGEISAISIISGTGVFTTDIYATEY